jgi:hypothetical protein
METSTIQLPPIYLEVDGVTVQLVEVSKQQLISGEIWYIASVRIIYKGVQSKVFPLFVKDMPDLKNKLKAEITKLKFTEYAYGIEEVRRLLA